MLKSHRGFSLVEVLVATGIMGIMGLAFAGFITDMFKQYRSLDSKSQLVDVVNEIRTELSSEAACLASFGGQNPTTGFNVTQLKDRNGTNTATQAPKTYGGIYRNLFSLTQMRVQDFDDSVSGVGDRIGSSSLLLTFAVSNGSTTTTTLVRPIRLHTEVNAAGAIIRCLALAGMTDGLWQRMSTSSQHIFYSGGNVGIGTTTPGSLLNVGPGAQGINMGMNPAGGGDQLTIANSTGNGYLYAYSSGSASSSIGSWSAGGALPLGLNPGGGFVGIGTNNPAGALHVSNGSIVLPANDSIVNTSAGTTAVGSGTRWLNLISNHTSGYGSITGTGPSGSHVGFPSGAALPDSASLLLINAGGTSQTRISQDALGFKAIANAGTMNFESPGTMTFETFGNSTIIARGGQFQIGSDTFRTSARIHSNTPNVLTLQRHGSGNLNSTIQYLNGSGKTIYAGMAGDETFGIGPNPNLSLSETWFEVNRSRGAQIRGFDPSVLTLTRTVGGLNTAIRYTNGSSRIYMGMSASGDFAVKSTDENLETSPWIRYRRDTSTFEVRGAVSATSHMNATAFNTSSDERLKTHIKPLENSLQKILRLQGVGYTWNETPLKGQKDMGFLAQKVQKVFPELVTQNNETGFFAVRYSSLIAPLVEALRELFNWNKNQDQEIQQLRQELAELREEVRILKEKSLPR